MSGAAVGTVAGATLGVISANNCFIEGTLVLTQFGRRPIESIEEGDYVLSGDAETGDITLKKVLHTFVNESDTLTHVTVEGETFTSTATHKIYVVDKGWINACELENNDLLIAGDGTKVRVENIETETLEEPVKVYNFEVEDYHTYFVGSGVLVHNLGCNTGQSNASSGRTFESQYDIPVNDDGYTKSSLELGKKVHKEYKADLADGISKIKEYVLPSGKRVDYIDLDNRVVYELKPNNPNQISKGTKQLAGYLEEVEAIFGKGWSSILDTY